MGWRRDGLRECREGRGDLGLLMLAWGGLSLGWLRAYAGAQARRVVRMAGRVLPVLATIGAVAVLAACQAPVGGGSGGASRAAPDSAAANALAGTWLGSRDDRRAAVLSLTNAGFWSYKWGDDSEDLETISGSFKADGNTISLLSDACEPGQLSVYTYTLDSERLTMSVTDNPCVLTKEAFDGPFLRQTASQSPPSATPTTATCAELSLSDSPGSGGVAAPAPPTKVTATIPVGEGLAWPVVAPDGSAVYLFSDGSVSVIDTATNKVTATSAVEGMWSPVVAPDGSAIYGLGNESVSVFDTATNTMTARIPVGEWLEPLGVAPDGSAIYLQTGDEVNVGNLSVIDTGTNTVTATVPVRDSADDMGGDLVVLPDGSAVYVTSERSGTASVIDTATNTVTATVSAEEGAWAPVVLPDGSAVYVSNGGMDVLVIDTATNTVTATIPVEGMSSSVVLPDGSAVYVTSEPSGTVSVIDTTTNTVTCAIPGGQSPVSPPVVLPDGSAVYLPITAGLLVIDTATKTVIATIRTDDIGGDIVVLPDESAVYVPSSDGTVSVIGGRTGR